MQGTIEIIGRKVYFVLSDAMNSDPVMIAHKWHISNNPEMFDGWKGAYGENGIVKVFYGSGTVARWRWEGKSDIVEQIEIPAPKSKREAKYRDGRWHLLYKSGWKAA